jgi:hypothetical protein
VEYLKSHGGYPGEGKKRKKTGKLHGGCKKESPESRVAIGALIFLLPKKKENLKYKVKE